MFNFNPCYMHSIYLLWQVVPHGASSSPCAGPSLCPYLLLFVFLIGFLGWIYLHTVYRRHTVYIFVLLCSTASIYAAACWYFTYRLYFRYVGVCFLAEIAFACILCRCQTLIPFVSWSFYVFFFDFLVECTCTTRARIDVTYNHSRWQFIEVFTGSDQFKTKGYKRHFQNTNNIS